MKKSREELLKLKAKGRLNHYELAELDKELAKESKKEDKLKKESKEDK